MSIITISIDITVPTSLTVAEVTRLFTDHHGYQSTVFNPSGSPTPNPQTRVQFAKATIARLVKEAIQVQKKMEDEKTLSTLDITVE